MRLYKFNGFRGWFYFELIELRRYIQIPDEILMVSRRYRGQIFLQHEIKTRKITYCMHDVGAACRLEGLAQICSESYHFHGLNIVGRLRVSDPFNCAK
jgi:hypothetical protein